MAPATTRDPQTEPAPLPATVDRERDQRLRLGGLIRERSSEIEARWLEQVHADVQRTGPRVSLTDLRDAIGDYLERLAQALCGEASVEPGAEAAWRDVASHHALTRVQLGFDVYQLVHEFIVLRRTIDHVVGENSPLSENLGGLLAELIEGAIAEAVRSYVESRDFATRKMQAEHVGFLTHELRNPLTTALVASSQLQRACGLSPEALRLVEVVCRSLERLDGLISQVLTAERLDAGRMPVNTKDIALTDLVRRAIEAATHQAKERGLVLIVEIDPKAVVQVDPDLATSALQNLVDNAVKFTDEGTVRVNSELRRDAVAVHVYDNCPGIPADQIEHLFEPFARGNSAKPGSGLGLAIARRAMEVVGGSVHAEAMPGRGCHFWLVLPSAASRGG
jgi:signal transduction histidine kinase